MSFRNTIRVSEDQCSVGPDPVQTVCKGYQLTTKVAASKERVKTHACYIGPVKPKMSA